MPRLFNTLHVLSLFRAARLSQVLLSYDCLIKTLLNRSFCFLIANHDAHALLWNRKPFPVSKVELKGQSRGASFGPLISRSQNTTINKMGHFRCSLVRRRAILRVLYRMSSRRMSPKCCVSSLKRSMKLGRFRDSWVLSCFRPLFLSPFLQNRAFQDFTLARINPILSTKCGWF